MEQPKISYVAMLVSVYVVLPLNTEATGSDISFGVFPTAHFSPYIPQTSRSHLLVFLDFSFPFLKPLSGHLLFTLCSIQA